MKRIKELDGLRVIAIFAVLLLHFRPAHDQTLDITSLGWAGVDLFFAISGFLITSILIDLRTKGECSLRTFYWRRMLRIFPPYYATVSIIILLAFVHGEPIYRRDIARVLTFVISLGHGYSLPLVLDRLFFHGGFSASPQPIITYHADVFWVGMGVFWSLSVEEWFYTLWAPVILKASRRAVLSFSVIPLFVCPALRALLHTSKFSEGFSFTCRFDSLAAGGCMAILFAAVKSGRLSRRILQRGLLLTIPISATALFSLSWHCGLFQGIELRSVTTFSIFGFTLLAIFFAAVTGACAHWSGSFWTSALRCKPITYIGTISYSMYLLHYPIYVAVGIAMAHKEWTTPMLWLQAAIAALCTIGVAALSWKYFESPILQFRDRPFFAHRPFMVPAETSAGD
jgi:peptidoglycan/LPS O-acetylase OafA/YrhL